MPPAVHKFDEFELDGARFELRRNGRPLKLERIPLELLILLAEKNGSVVTREEIVDRLWGKDVFVDTEHGINTAIRKIRTALRDDAERSRFIQTVSGKGYRFVAELSNGDGRAVRLETPLETKPPASVTLAQSEPVPAQVRHPGTRLTGGLAAGIAALALLLIAAAAVGLNIAGLRDRVFARSKVGPIQSLAVLPLVNLSGDSSQDYFADGMTDELITALAQNRSLRVVSRTSAMQYKGVSKPLRDIARELGVDGILEGSVSRSGNRVHINLQLIYAPTDTHLWAQSYDRDTSGVLSLSEELSQTIPAQAKVSSDPVKFQRHINPEAHDAYLRGRYFWFGGDLDRSQKYFEEAIRLEPDYAAAWSGVADVYTVRAVGLVEPPREVIPKARDAAERAVKLDDSLPEAHNSLGAVRLFGDWDLQGADEESRRSIALSPTFAEARHLHCYILAILNRPDEAVEEQKRGMEIDPFARPWALGLALIRARQFDAAINELRMRAEAQPQNDIHFLQAEAYWQKGMRKEYAQEVEKGYLVQNDKESVGAIRRAFASGGGEAVAEWDINKAKAQARKGYCSPWQLAYLSARLRRTDETLRYLEEAFQEHSARIIFLQVEPVFDFLHADERYRALVKKIGLPPAY